MSTLLFDSDLVLAVIYTALTRATKFSETDALEFELDSFIVRADNYKSLERLMIVEVVKDIDPDVINDKIFRINKSLTKVEQDGINMKVTVYGKWETL